MSKRTNPSAEYLRECFRYEDGKLFWMERPRSHFNKAHGWNIFNTNFSGKEAGCPLMTGKLKKPCWTVVINRKLHKRHRVVWAFFNDEWPKRIDHKNRNQLDDKIDNLRPCTQSQNASNVGLTSRNTSGYKGVYCRKDTGRFVAQIQTGGVHRRLGEFGSAPEAYEAYKAAASALCGEFACTPEPRIPSSGI